jgi:hypothetical protein
LYFHSGLLYFQSGLLYCQSDILYLQSGLLYFQSDLLYFQSDLLYFHSGLLHFISLFVCFIYIKLAISFCDCWVSSIIYHLELTIWLSDNLVNLYLINVIYLEFYSIVTRNNTHNQQDVLLIHQTIALIVCTCMQRYILYLTNSFTFLSSSKMI